MEAGRRIYDFLSCSFRYNQASRAKEINANIEKDGLQPAERKGELQMLKIVENELSPETFREIFEAVGWEPPSLRQIETALSNSWGTDGRSVLN